MFRHTGPGSKGHIKRKVLRALMLHNFVPVERSFDNLKLKLFIEVKFSGKTSRETNETSIDVLSFGELKKAKAGEIIPATSSNLLNSAV